MGRKNHILIDGRTFSLQTKGGVSQLWAKILGEKTFYAQSDISLVLYPGADKNIHLNEALATIGPQINVIRCSQPPSDNHKYAAEEHRKRREVEIQASLTKDVQVVLNTYYGENIFRRCNNYIVVAHDYAHEDLEILATKASTAGVLQRKAMAFDEAKTIISVSHETLRRGLAAYPANAKKKNVVIYHGHDSTPVCLPKVGKQILHVGSRGAYKNFDILCQAVESILQKNQEVSFVIAGGEPIDQRLTQMVSRFGPRVLYTTGMSDAQMNALMAVATVFVSASLYEGFGIPVLNALRLQTAPVLSDIAVYREVAGPAGRFFDPASQESIETVLQNALKDTAKKPSLYYRSWNAVAAEYAEIIQEITNDHT